MLDVSGRAGTLAIMSASTATEPAPGWRERVSAAATATTGTPAPSVEHLQIFFDLLQSLEGYLYAAAAQWCHETGDQAVQWCAPGSHEGCPAPAGAGIVGIDWEDTTAESVVFSVHRSHGDYYGAPERLVIPVADLFPEFGERQMLMKVLTP